MNSGQIRRNEVAEKCNVHAPRIHYSISREENETSVVCSRKLRFLSSVPLLLIVNEECAKRLFLHYFFFIRSFIDQDYDTRERTAAAAALQVHITRSAVRP